MRVFLDASVIFAAALSQTGASRELFRLAAEGEVQLVASQFVLEEAERNLASKAAPETVAAFRLLVDIVEVEITPDPSRDEITAAATFTALKDAPVVAAAIKARPDYLVTFDRKHLIDPPQIAERSGLRIVVPKVVLHALRMPQ